MWKRDFVVRRGDLASGTVLLAVGVFAIVVAARLPFGSATAPGAGFYPLVLGVLLVVFSAAIVVRALRLADQAVRFSPGAGRAMVTAAALILYALWVDDLGYVPATAAVMLLMLRGLGGLGWRKAVILAAVGVVGSYVAFTRLGVPLPRGLLPI